MKKTAIALVLSVAGLAGALPLAAQAFNAQEVLNTLSQHGLVAPHNLEKQYGYWSAKVTLQDGSRAYALVSDTDGSVVTIRKSDLGTTYPGAAQVEAQLQAQGFAQLHDLEFDDGFWEAEVRDANNRKTELIIHPVTLQVLHQSGNASNNNGTAAPVLSATQITQLLQQAGYTRIHDLELDDGVWEADATNAKGLRVELKIHPETGAVLREKLDD
ncbi:PepSY domain-containing protein [Comamonas sp. J-3]|uniref:PepSY domain-containing protein n=1 Tax=Comamonas trifloxystrobinivorans TaxID=3350256 RepID=UPI003729DB61